MKRRSYLQASQLIFAYGFTKIETTQQSETT